MFQSTNRQKLEIDRRALLKLGLSTGVLARLPLAGCIIADATSDYLLEIVSTSDLPIDPTRTGQLSDADFQQLSSMCQYVARTWELSTDLDGYLARLRNDLVFKTREEPSYLSEYENAAEAVNRVRGELESNDQSWSSLLFAELPASDLAATRIGRARRLVFAEMVIHQMSVSGAFKSFGLVNYAGYYGGPYMAAGSYRKGRG